MDNDHVICDKCVICDRSKIHITNKCCSNCQPPFSDVRLWRSSCRYCDMFNDETNHECFPICEKRREIYETFDNLTKLRYLTYRFSESNTIDPQIMIGMYVNLFPGQIIIGNMDHGPNNPNNPNDPIISPEVILLVKWLAYNYGTHELTIEWIRDNLQSEHIELVLGNSYLAIQDIWTSYHTSPVLK